jgi:hypothetical protein
MVNKFNKKFKTFKQIKNIHKEVCKYRMNLYYN